MANIDCVPLFDIIPSTEEKHSWTSLSAGHASCCLTREQQLMANDAESSDVSCWWRQGLLHSEVQTLVLRRHENSSHALKNGNYKCGYISLRTYKCFITFFLARPCHLSCPTATVYLTFIKVTETFIELYVHFGQMIIISSPLSCYIVHLNHYYYPVRECFMTSSGFLHAEDQVI
jgi:hypothetical protein